MKKIIMVLFVCMSSLGYGADFQDPYEYDFDTDLALPAVIEEDQPSDGAVLALPVSRDNADKGEHDLKRMHFNLSAPGPAPAPFFMDGFEDLPFGQIDPGNFYFCRIQGCFACFSTIQDRTDHEIDVHGQGYLQVFESQLNYDAGNDEMMMLPQDGLESFDFQQPVIVPAPALVQRFMDVQPGQKICHVCNKQFLYHSRLKVHMTTHTGERPFTCKECSKSFSRKSILKQHMKIHKKADNATFGSLNSE